MEQDGVVEQAPDQEAASLYDEEKLRYATQIKLFALASTGASSISLSDWKYSGEPQQAALKNSTVLIAGASVAASDLVRTLSLAGIGTLILVALEHPPSLSNDESKSVIKPLGAEVRKLNPFVNFFGVESIDDVPGTLQSICPNILVYC